MADRLEIYRGALRHLGQQRLASLSEEGPSRRALDDAWRPSVEFLLGKGLWNFALRAVEIGFDGDVEPRFGYEHGFRKPDDWIRTAGLGDDWGFGWGPADYQDEGRYWFANGDTLCIRYVSNADEWGFNVGEWRQPFAKTLEAYLAFECGLPINNDKGDRNSLFNLYGRLLKEAKTLDAVDERVQFRSTGRLARSRGSRSYRGPWGTIR